MPKLVTDDIELDTRPHCSIQAIGYGVGVSAGVNVSQSVQAF